MLHQSPLHVKYDRSSFGSPSNILNTIKKSFKNIIPSTIPKIFAKTPIKICSVIIIPITLDFVAPINIYNPNSFLRASMKIEVEYKINMTKKEMIITLHMISPQRTVLIPHRLLHIRMHNDRHICVRSKYCKTTT